MYRLVVGILPIKTIRKSESNSGKVLIWIQKSNTIDVSLRTLPNYRNKQHCYFADSFITPGPLGFFSAAFGGHQFLPSLGFPPRSPKIFSPLRLNMKFQNLYQTGSGVAGLVWHWSDLRFGNEMFWAIWEFERFERFRASTCLAIWEFCSERFEILSDLSDLGQRHVLAIWELCFWVI